MDKRKTTNGQTMIYTTLNRKQKIEKLVTPQCPTQRYYNANSTKEKIRIQKKTTTVQTER
jgi:hypothetical protein